VVGGSLEIPPSKFSPAEFQSGEIQYFGWQVLKSILSTATVKQLQPTYSQTSTARSVFNYPTSNSSSIPLKPSLPPP
jgi:hypothetical protein